MATRPRPRRRRAADAGAAHGRLRVARRRPGERAWLRRLPPSPATTFAGYHLRRLPPSPATTFAGYHRVLNHVRRNAREAAGRRLLALLVAAAFVPAAGKPVVVALDDTPERRWGRRIRARGIYRDPVRSSHGHAVKASGLRWLSVMLVPPVPWAGRAWALPFVGAAVRGRCRS